MITSDTFYKTFSGADTIAFALFPNCKPILMGSVTTISYSIYRDKKPVPAIGKINVRGFTRGMRIIAGTMVFTVINQHFVKDIIENIPYLKNYVNMKSDELPIFDVMVVSANEYGANSQMQIYGIDLTDDSTIISVEDLFSENVLKFVARDLDEFTMVNPLVGSSNVRRTNGVVLSSISPFLDSKETIKEFYSDNNKYGKDSLLKIQSKFKNMNMIEDVNGVYDDSTFNAVKVLQSRMGMKETGIYDEAFVSAILDDDRKIFTITNKGTTYIYNDIHKSDVIGVVPYGETFKYEEAKNGMLKVRYYGTDGFVSVDDTNLKYEDKKYFQNNILNDNTVYTCTKDNLIDYINQIGCEIDARKDLEIKMTTVSYYNDDKFEINYRYLNVDKDTKRKALLSYIPESYIYNSEFRQFPNTIEFFVMVNENNPVKWTLKINELEGFKCSQ